MRKIHIGKENATFQQLIALKENRKKRSNLKQFFVEGIANIKEAMNNNYKIVAFIYTKNKDLSNWAKGIINKAEFNYVLTENLFNILSAKDVPSELLAIVEYKDFVLEYESLPLYVLVDRPSNKGNFGAIIRSCDALGVNRVYYSGHGVDSYDSAVIRASMGSFFKLPIIFINSNDEFLNLINECKEKYSEFNIVGTSLQNSIKVNKCNFKSPTILLIGNEKHGLNKFYQEQSNCLVKIPMIDNVDSLNVACATTVCLYEAWNQRNID